MLLIIRPNTRLLYKVERGRISRSSPQVSDYQRGVPTSPGGCPCIGTVRHFGSMRNYAFLFDKLRSDENKLMGTTDRHCGGVTVTDT